MGLIVKVQRRYQHNLLSRVNPYLSRGINGENLRKEKVCWAFSLLIIATLILAESSIVPHVFAQSDQPVQMHLTWDLNDTAHSIVVTWQTETAGTGDLVRYDAKSGSGNPSNYKSSQTGTNHTYSGADGYIHDVELTGLSADTVYYFICGGDNGGWSGEHSFRTAPDNSMSFRFVAGGDSRPGSGDWPSGRDSVSSEMSKFSPSFVLYVGDFVLSGTNQSQWDNWFAAEQMYWVDNNNLTIPIIPCLGNHDVGGTYYLDQFSLPEDEKWYSLDWGPNLHITVLDTETTMTGDQLDWLRQDLATHENYMWKVVLFHEPPYSDGQDGVNSSVLRYWVPVFDNYHVDLVISGHNHLYERTYPLENGAISDNVADNGAVYVEDNGTIYVVSGGWGAPLYSASPSWFAAKGPISKYSFTVVDILDNGMLHLRGIDRDGNVLDDFSIQKTVPESAKPISTLPYVIAVVVVFVVIAVIAFYLLRVRRKS